MIVSILITVIISLVIGWFLIKWIDSRILAEINKKYDEREKNNYGGVATGNPRFKKTESFDAGFTGTQSKEHLPATGLTSEREDNPVSGKNNKLTGFLNKLLKK